MAAADEPVAHPPGPTDITAKSPSSSVGLTPGDFTVAEPPPAAPAKVTKRDPETLARRLLRIDVVLVACVLLFAFEVASFLALNKDLWLRLGTGQALFKGDYTFGTDPFAHTTEGVYWTNHAWLSDALMYGLHALGGVPALVVLKALAVALLAWVMMRTGRTDRGWWVPALCCGLAILALSPRLFLRPMVVSMLFLGLTLFFLQRGGRWLYRPGGAEEPRGKKGTPVERVTWKDYWPLLVLFALWANMDEWFFLGPITVALYAAGQALQQGGIARKTTADTPRLGEVQALGVVLVLGVVCCLANPHHYHVFSMPPQLGFSQVSDFMKFDPSASGLFLTSVDPRLFVQANVSVAHLAYFPLAFLGLISFLVNLKGTRWWRVMVFVPFLIFSLLHLQAVPFFAVLAAPIMALNFQEGYARRSGAAAFTNRGTFGWRLGGRVLSVLALLLLLGVAWPGWLQARPYENRRVAWGAEPEPSLERLTAWLKEQHAPGGMLADSRGFSLSPDVAHFLAWHAPEVKSFSDGRHQLFTHVAKDSVEVRKSLLAPIDVQTFDWPRILQHHGVDYFILYPAYTADLFELNDLFVPLFRLWNISQAGDSKDWVLLYQDGRAAVFGWAKLKPGYREKQLDPERAAYRPAEADQAPAGGLKRRPEPRAPWDAFTRSPLGHSLDSDEAKFHLLLFEADGPAQIRKNVELWLGSLAAGSVGNSTEFVRPSFPALLSMHLQTLQTARQRGERRVIHPGEAIADQIAKNFHGSRDQGPPHHLFLALRAARRAVAQQPDDPVAHARLGEAYYHLTQRTRERIWDNQILWADQDKIMATSGFPYPLRHIRVVQATTALNTSLQLKPDQEYVHGYLADLYGQMGLSGGQRFRGGFKDLELKHRQLQLRYARLARGRPWELPEVRQGYLDGLEKEVSDLEKIVQKLDNDFENGKRNKKTAALAQFAYDHSLGGKALEILLGASGDELGSDGQNLLFELLLLTGQGRDVSEALGLEGKDTRGNMRLQWYRILIAAALGDYEAADAALLDVASMSDRTMFLNSLVSLHPIGLVKPQPPAQPKPLNVPEAAALIYAQAMQDGAMPPMESLTWAVESFRGGYSPIPANHALTSIRACLTLNGEGAAVHTIRGLLLLERGDPGRAREAFEQSSKLLKLAGPVNPLGNDPYSQMIAAIRTINDESLKNLQERP